MLNCGKILWFFFNKSQFTERGPSVELPPGLVLELVAGDDVARDDDEGGDPDEEGEEEAQEEHLGRVQAGEAAAGHRGPGWAEKKYKMHIILSLSAANYLMGDSHGS